MHKHLGYIIALGIVSYIDSAHARMTCASECPQIMSIPDLKKIVATPEKATVAWKGGQWTVVSMGVQSLQNSLPPLATQFADARNINGMLRCYYDVFSGVNEQRLGRIGLSICLLDMKK